jgi:hypothetical protein
MGSDAGLTIHPHPTLSETIGMAAEAFEGTITDLYLPNKRRRRRRLSKEIQNARISHRRGR